MKHLEEQLGCTLTDLRQNPVLKKKFEDAMKPTSDKEMSFREGKEGRLLIENLV
jgi:hypothetical protein